MSAALLAVVLCLSWLLATGTPAVAAGGRCSSSTRVETHYLLDTADGPLTISGVVLSGFDPATCDGRAVRVSFSGNAAGDPGAPAHLLSVMGTSAVGCGRDPAGPPVVIRSGSITVRGCAEESDPHEAAFVDVHDVTAIRVQVTGAGPPDVIKAEVLGTHAIQDGAGPPTAPASGHSLGETGGPWLMAAHLGVAFLLLGILALSRRTRITKQA